MIVKSKQIDSIKDDALRAFAERLARHLRRSFPERTAPLTDLDLATMVEGRTRQALQLDFSTEIEAACFVELALLLGLKIDDDDVASFLADNRITPRAKLERLYTIAHSATSP